MRVRVGIALLLAALTGTGLLIAWRDRDAPPPAPRPPPPGVIALGILPRPEPARAPAESPSGDDSAEPLEPAGKESEEPDEPDDIEIRQGAEMKLRTGPDGKAEPAETPDPPKPAVDSGSAPEPVDAPSAREPEVPPKKEKELLPGKEVAPLPGPVDDPADLPTPEEIEEGTAPAPGEEPPAQDTLLAGLNDFLRVMTLDGRIQIKFTGRLYLDAALMSAEQELDDLVGDFNSGGQFRAARIGLLGVIDWFEFKIDYDIAGGQTLVGEPELKDLWFGARDVPLLGRLRLGRMKEPLGLEQWMSGNARTFLEPGLPKAITIGRNPGVLAWGTELGGRLSWWVGVFGHTPNQQQFGTPGRNLSSRICGTPWFQDKGKRLVHVGLSTSFRSGRAEEMSIAQRP